MISDYTNVNTFSAKTSVKRESFFKKTQCNAQIFELVVFPTLTCQDFFIKKVEISTSNKLFILSVNGMKKADLAEQIMALRGKVITDFDLPHLCD